MTDANDPLDNEGAGDNAEQMDEPGQAHTVTDDALRHQDDDMPTLETADERSDVPGGDLVDTMRDMVDGGIIDDGAYATSRNDDDEPDALGGATRMDGDPVDMTDVDGFQVDESSEI